MHRALAPRPDDLRAHVRLRREFRAAAVARRGGARQEVAARQDAAATRGSSSRRCARTTRSMWAHPGKKLLFMGQEFAQGREWNFDTGLDWPSLSIGWHSGVQALVRDCNRLLWRGTRAARARLRSATAFAGSSSTMPTIPCSRGCASRGDGARPVAVIANFTPVPRPGYRIGLPAAGPLARDPEYRRRRLRRLELRQRGRRRRARRRMPWPPFCGRRHVAAARNPLAGARRRRMISPAGSVAEPKGASWTR